MQMTSQCHVVEKIINLLADLSFFIIVHIPVFHILCIFIIHRLYLNIYILQTLNVVHLIGVKEYLN